MKIKSLIIKVIVIVVFGAIFIFTAFYLNSKIHNEKTAASKLIFSNAVVTKIISEDVKKDDWTEGRRLGNQIAEVKIKSGKYKDLKLNVVNYLNAYTNVDLKKGTNIIVRLDYDNQQKIYVSGVFNYNRLIVLSGLIFVFLVLLIFLGGKKGLSALLGLAFTIICVWYLLIPLMMIGVLPILVSIIICAVSSLVSLILLNGLSLKTLSATLGCVGGVVAAGLSAFIIGIITPLNGFNMAEAEEIVLRADKQIHISGLLVAGILIASLGAVMDIAMTITSSVYEINKANNKLTTIELFKSGMNIGRDAMGTMANTLILAFAGASLNTLMLFRIFDYPYLQIFNSDMIAIEIIQGVAGSIGIILTVPLVAYLSAVTCKKTRFTSD